MIKLNWKNPNEELPKEGTTVGVIYEHWKGDKFQRSEMMFGEVGYDRNGKNGRVCSCDYTGKGNWSVYFDEETEVEGYGTIRNNDVAIAWIYAEDFPMPDWIK